MTRWLLAFWMAAFLTGSSPQVPVLDPGNYSLAGADLRPDWREPEVWRGAWIDPRLK